MNRITRCFIFLALCALDFEIGDLARAEDLDAPKAAAIVNGEVITNLEVTLATPATDRDSVDARKDALEKKIDLTLMVQAVRQRMSKPPTEFVDERVEEIVKQDFQGDQASFEAELQKNGYTLKLFKKFQEEQILVELMKREICGKESNPVAREEQIAAWLVKARAEAKIVYQ